MKILAAIVTHNRSNLLVRCVDYVAAQTRKPDSLIVIDNGSTDDTQLVLAKKNVRSIVQENVGSAGGWKKCIDVAVDEGFDAVWLMDDDGYPKIDALKKLEISLNKGFSAVSSIVVRESNPNRFVFPFPRLDKVSKKPVFLSFKRKYKYLDKLKSICNKENYQFAHFFNGALIPMESIKNIGNINDKYFIAGEEVDYFYRLREVGEVVSVFSAIHYHPDVSSRIWSELKFYYFIKNTIIINHKIYKFPYFKDIATIVIALLRIAHRNSVSEFISYIIGKKSKIFYRAISKGYRLEIGKDYNGKC